MEREYRNSQLKIKSGQTTMRLVYDITMALLILSMGAILLLGNKLNLTHIIQLDPLMRYMFAGLCLLYGGFRLYRALKRDDY